MTELRSGKALPESDMTVVPLAAVNQYAYCPRRCYYIYVAGEFLDNEHTVEGEILHERVHGGETRTVGDKLELRAVRVYSPKYGLIGVMDLLEIKEGEYCPVEYKKGRRGDWENDQLQLCAQALALEDALKRPVERGFIYYASSGRRQAVEFTPWLREKTLQVVEKVRRLLDTGYRPPALEGPRCRGCSLKDVCLPQEVRILREMEAN
ncbi:MAG: CRISPR-associated protein Cas4 [Firmicutes bacterium]|nr:CRISPR-associated protein Cas4 [Bacillota bacterium]